ncbi:MAG TPA: tetratricopeptide repeat protein [Bacteroidota bacterium]|nr:tetratricopeptide repeat protein [Bacteroidota bacterium]
MRKRRFFSLIVLATPFLLLGMLEAGLRFFDYGANLSLFTRTTIQGKTYYLLNHQVKARYFPDIRFGATSAREYFAVPKPSGAFRVFVLGGSTAVGYPYGPNGSFASFLRQRLSNVFPDRRIEIINIGMTGTNSYTVLDLAHELPAYEPDLLLVYDGHNEFYGGLGVQSRGVLGGNRFTTMAYLRLLHFRIFVLLRDAYSWLGAIVHPASQDAPRDVSLESLAQGKEVPYRSTVYLEALSIFRDNLAELTAFCREHHLPLILSSQVSNLRGQAPFLSAKEDQLPVSQKRAFDADRQNAAEAWNAHRWADALRGYRSAASFDTLHAAVRFAIGRSLDVLGDRPGARLEYIRARDYDQLRFRASSDFNSAILAQSSPGTVFTVDMERLFMEYSPDSLIGNELILEHLHPNSFGSFLMAKGFAAAIRALGLIASADEWAHRDTVADRRLWEERTVTDLDERIALERTARLTSSYPFTERSLSVPGTFPKDSIQVFAHQVVNGVWGSGDAHFAAAAYYEKRGDLVEAEREYRTIISLDSLEVRSYLGLARLYVQQNRFVEATKMLSASLQVEPTGAAYALLADMNFNRGENASAATLYEEAVSLISVPQEQASLWFHLALAELRLHDRKKAEEALQKALNASPQDEQSLALRRALHGLQGAP